MKNVRLTGSDLKVILLCNISITAPIKHSLVSASMSHCTNDTNDVRCAIMHVQFKTLQLSSLSLLRAHSIRLCCCFHLLLQYFVVFWCVNFVLWRNSEEQNPDIWTYVENEILSYIVTQNRRPLRIWRFLFWNSRHLTLWSVQSFSLTSDLSPFRFSLVQL